MSNDDDYLFLDFHNQRSCEVVEDERDIEDTGLLGPNGRPLFRIPLPKPRIGFHPPDDEKYLFDLDPDSCFIYSET